MSERGPFLSHLNPMALASFRNWVRLVSRSGGIDARYWPKALYVTASSLSTVPWRAAEHVFYGKAIRETPIAQPPLFILGHWRTGTTFLHNVLSRDPQLGYVPTYQTIAPGFSLVGEHIWKPLLRMLLPGHRPQDHVELGTDLPQEEEVALPSLCPHSFYAGYFFPARMDEFFTRYALLEGISAQEREEWRAAYLYVLKKATLCAQGRRLVLKNPVNTGRIAELVQLFPGAKYIHIHRNPYVVYNSTLRLYSKMLEISAFQKYTEEELGERVFRYFSGMMRRYFEQRDLVPQGDLVEIRFEDFEADPLGQLERAYAQLRLPGFEAARPEFEAYLGTLKNYSKNQYALPAALADRIEREWGFAIERWGYTRPTG